MGKTARVIIGGLLVTALVAPTTYSANPADAADLSFPVVETGQTTTYGNTGAIAPPESGEEFYGQDAQYTGTEPSYLDNGDGTVTDLVTGLMWQQNPGTKMTYSQAVAGAESFDLGDYDDWRLPTIKELYSLIDFSGTDPSGCQTLAGCNATPFIDTDYFEFEYGDTSAGERVIDAQYASSTKYVSFTMGGDETAFGVNFADGRIKGYGLSHPQGGEMEFFVLYVRGNPEYGENDFTDNGDGTITDTATGLMWQQLDSGTGLDWSESLAYCETSTEAGYDDWTLPDVKQLQSIVDYTRSPATTNSAAIDPIFDATTITDEGGDTNWGFYWSSTTHANQQGGGTFAAYVAFGEGLGWMQPPFGGGYTLQDVHGAGTQRSDPKTGDAADYPNGHGPQGDVVRIDNFARCVRTTVTETPTCDGLAATIVGTAGDDRLIGTAADDVIWAGSGDDLVKGKGGNDTICLGGGADEASGGSGSDTIFGGSGADVIAGGGGRDRISGNKGNDVLAGGAKKDVLNGNGGDDQLSGDGGNDRLRGGGGTDTGNAGSGSDWCRTLENMTSCER
jgi:Ca2+-binding RTX toxin-like protein